MKYQLLTDKGNIYYYDNYQNIFYDKFGNYLNLKARDEALPFYHYSDNFKDIAYRFEDRIPGKERYVDLNNLFHVKFQLGLNCNYKCLYCSQRICGQQEVKPIDIERFKSLCRQSKLDWPNIKAIEFWGGEPFVYWKYVKDLPKFFREELGFNGFFHITTNVALYDNEKSDWSFENNVHYMFSHDGVNHKAQRSEEDWLDDNHKCQLVRERLKDSPYSSVHAVFAPMNDTNLWHTMELFKKRLGDRATILMNTGMRCDSTNQYLMAEFTPEKVESLKKYWFEIMTQCFDLSNTYYKMMGAIRYYVKERIERMINSRTAGSFVHNCPTKSRHSLVFTMDGQYIPCHGSSLEQGLSAGDILHLDQCRDFGYTSVHHRTLCKDCPFITQCGGPCGFYNDRSVLYFCKSTIWNHETTFKACFYMLTGEYIEQFIKVNKECNQ